MSLPVGITVNSYDDILIGDRDNCRILNYDNLGNFKMLFGKSGSGDGYFQAGRLHPAVDQFDRIFVTDYFQSCLQIFEADGTFISRLGAKSNSILNSEFHLLMVY